MFDSVSRGLVTLVFGIGFRHDLRSEARLPIRIEVASACEMLKLAADGQHCRLVHKAVGN